MTRESLHLLLEPHVPADANVVGDGETLTLSDESTDVRWWTIAEAAGAGDESLARLLHATT